MDRAKTLYQFLLQIVHVKKRQGQGRVYHFNIKLENDLLMAELLTVLGGWVHIIIIVFPIALHFLSTLSLSVLSYLSFLSSSFVCSA